MRSSFHEVEAPSAGSPRACVAVLTAAFLLAFLVTADLARAQAASPAASPLDIVETYRQGMNAFNAGDYAAAIEKLKSVLAQAAPDSPQIEPLQFTLGAAYFNAKDYSNAIAIFTQYQKKYPKSARLNEITFALGQAQLLNGQTADAMAIFKQLENVPAFRDQSLLFAADSALKAGNTDSAIAALERLNADGIRNLVTARGAVKLVLLYLQRKDTAKATALLAGLQRNSQFVENVVALNSLTLQLGDKLLEEGDYAAALDCFRRVRLKEGILALQRARIVEMQKRIEQNLADNLRDPSKALRNLAANAQIRASIDAANAQLAEFEKMAPIQGALYLRMARCFSENLQRWEAIVVYEELLDRVASGPEREIAAYALVVTYSEVNQAKAALDACARYLKEFPNGPNAESVRYLRGTIALQTQNFKDGEGWLLDLLKQQPKPELAQQIFILLGNAKFTQGKYDEAIEQYRKYLEGYPKGDAAEDADYRIALAQLFNGKFEDAIPGFQAYLKKYPQGGFASDAKYRLAVCDYAAQEYQKVVDDCHAWEKEFPDNSQLGEVAALLGDAYGALGQTDEAVQAYELSAQKATTDEVLNYSIFEAAKLLQKQGRWPEISAMFENFVKEKPDHPTALAALFWIAKAKAHEGKVDEAKQFLSETIRKYIDDPTREPVEQMLTQLAQLCAKRTAPAPQGDGGNATPAPTPDPTIELDTLLAFAKGSPTAKAREIFAMSELARLRRQPAEQQKLLKKIADDFKPEDLSPMLIGLIGDNLLSTGQLDRAAMFYKYLRDYYPKSPFLDYAYAGLGGVALERNDAPLALRYFTDGTDKIVPVSKVKDLTLGQAKALLALGRLEDARKIFEQVAATREWRGEATSESIYSLGEIQWKQGKWAEANAYYQRLYVTYRRYLPWVARAYLKSAECFVKLGRPQDAIKTYNEMLRDDKLANLPEVQTARARLQELNPQ